MNNKYIAPDQNLDSFTCPHCQTLSLMTRGIHHFEQDLMTDDIGNPIPAFDEFGDYDIYFNELIIKRCHSCGKKIIWIDGE